MDEDQGGGVQFKRALGDLPRVDGDVIDRAFALLFVGDQSVLPVEVENAELLRLTVGHGGMAVIEQRIPT